MASVAILAFIGLTVPSVVNAQDTSQALWDVAWKTSNDRVNDLVSSMTPEEKVDHVHHFLNAGTQDFAGYLNVTARLGIPAIQLTDGEAGVNGVVDTTSIPSQLNVASTFNRSLAYDAGAVAGKESWYTNASVLLAPRTNILRDPIDGNFFQGYSEDPYLNGQLGLYAVRGIQDQGTMANAKQLGVSPDGSSGSAAGSELDNQTLHEVYLAAMEPLIQNGVATVMCSYTQVNGVPSCQNDEILNLTLRGDWNFTGLVMSDWGATHSTAASIIAGLDLEMGTNEYYTQPLYDQVYVYQNLSESYLNRAVANILFAYERFGLLNGTGPMGDSLDVVLEGNELPDFVANESQRKAYEIAVRSGILLKNDGALPLSKNSSGSVAVFGATGRQLTNGGENFGERSYGTDSRKVAPIDALKSSAPGLNITYAVGVDLHGTPIPASAFRTLDGQQQGLQRNDSVSTSITVDAALNFAGKNALAANTDYTWTGQLLANTTGWYRIALQRRYAHIGGAYNDTTFWQFHGGWMTVNGTTTNSYRIYLDGGVHAWSGPVMTLDGWDETGVDVYFEAGPQNISVTANSIFNDPIEVRLSWVTPEQREENYAKAVTLASTVDVPVVFAHGLDPPPEYLHLVHGHDELIQRIAAVNPNTIVVLHNTDPVVMPWLDAVSSVLWMGHPGQEGGQAIADLLLGNHNPQGHLSVTYPASLNTSMTRNPEYPWRIGNSTVPAVLDEGINTAYRYYLDTNTSVLFPFGYGLSYTSFEYNNLQIQKGPGQDSLFNVSFTLNNTGSVTGADVPQLYVGPPSGAGQAYSGVQFAVAALTGFDSIKLVSGASTVVTFPISERQLSFWNQTDRSWVVARGTRQIWIGTDAQTVVLEGHISV